MSDPTDVFWAHDFNDASLASALLAEPDFAPVNDPPINSTAVNHDGLFDDDFGIGDMDGHYDPDLSHYLDTGDGFIDLEPPGLSDSGQEVPSGVHAHPECNQHNATYTHPTTVPDLTSLMSDHEKQTTNNIDEPSAPYCRGDHSSSQVLPALAPGSTQRHTPPVHQGSDTPEELLLRWERHVNTEASLLQTQHVAATPPVVSHAPSPHQYPATSYLVSNYGFDTDAAMHLGSAPVHQPSTSARPPFVGVQFQQDYRQLVDQRNQDPINTSAHTSVSHYHEHSGTLSFPHYEHHFEHDLNVSNSYTAGQMQPMPSQHGQNAAEMQGRASSSGFPSNAAKGNNEAGLRPHRRSVASEMSSEQGLDNVEFRKPSSRRAKTDQFTSRALRDRFQCLDCLKTGRESFYQDTGKTGEGRCKKHFDKWTKDQKAGVAPEYSFDNSVATYEAAYYKAFSPWEPLRLEGDDYQNFEGREGEWVKRFIVAANKPYESGPVGTIEPGSKEDKMYADQQKEFNQKPYQKTGGHWYTDGWVTARFTLLFFAVLNFHRGGPRPYAVGGDNAGYGNPDRSLKCSKRLETIEEILSYDKRVVINIIEGMHVCVLAETPGKVAKRKVSNNHSNKNKEAEREIARQLKTGKLSQVRDGSIVREDGMLDDDSGEDGEYREKERHSFGSAESSAPLASTMMTPGTIFDNMKLPLLESRVNRGKRRASPAGPLTRPKRQQARTVSGSGPGMTRSVDGVARNTGEEHTALHSAASPYTANTTHDGNQSEAFATPHLLQANASSTTDHGPLMDGTFEAGNAESHDWIDYLGG